MGNSIKTLYLILVISVALFAQESHAQKSVVLTTSGKVEDGKKHAVTEKMKAKPKTVVTHTNKFGTFTDSRDGKTYKTVVIGAQTWMAENLNFGTMVLDSNEQNNDSKVEKYCYENQSSNCTTDGGLYQWAEAMALPSFCTKAECKFKIKSKHKGICPRGWHIPKAEEWNTLATYLGGESNAGKTMKLNATGFSIWDVDTYNEGNSSGFSAFPAGSLSYYGNFVVRGSRAFFWEATESGEWSAYFRLLHYSNSNLHSGKLSKLSGFSVRCLSDL